MKDIKRYKITSHKGNSSNVTRCDDGHWVHYSEVEQLQARIKELESENINLFSAIQEHSEGFYICPVCSYEMGCKDHAVVNALNKVPTTKEIINEIKAQGIEYAVGYAAFDCTIHDDPVAVLEKVEYYAEKLRTNHGKIN